MKLVQLQQEFTVCVGLLIAHLTKLGYGATLGDAYRDPRVHGMIGVKKSYGHKNSAHKRRLAVDLNLFRDGEYLDATADHEPIGVWWEQLGEKRGVPLRWGGRFNDGNHYSLEHGGVK